MWLNHEYWCECIWQTNDINKTAQWTDLTVGLPVTSERYWASFPVNRLFHNATVSQCDHFFCCYTRICCLKLWIFTRLITRMKIFLRGVGGRVGWSGGRGLPRFGGGALSSSVFTIWCRILISRPPRVYRRFKCRSCFYIRYQPYKLVSHINIVDQSFSWSF